MLLFAVSRKMDEDDGNTVKGFLFPLPVANFVETMKWNWVDWHYNDCYTWEVKVWH